MCWALLLLLLLLLLPLLFSVNDVENIYWILINEEVIMLLKSFRTIIIHIALVCVLGVLLYVLYVSSVGIFHCNSLVDNSILVWFYLHVSNHARTSGADQTIPNIWHNTIESSEINRPRSKRGKVPRASNLRIKSDVKQHLDANDNDAMPMEDIQTNFLSESVRKYLELGRAIPGKRIDKFKTF